MGCAASKQPNIDINDPLYLAKQADRAISEALALSNKQRKPKKLLLLGTGESGKSTVLKQLKILHKNGFSHQERQQYSQVIWADAVNCMAKLIIQARKLKIPLDCDAQNNTLSKHRDVLFVYQHALLDDIDTEMAGGEKFLVDYHSKYSPFVEWKRQQDSTGQTEAFEEDLEGSTDQELHTLITENFASDGEAAADSVFNEASSTVGSNSQHHRHLDGSMTTFIRKTNPTVIAKQISRAQVAEAITQLWHHDKGIKAVYERASEFQLELNADYYFNNVAKFANEDYLANNEDILKARIKTTGITETNFTISGEEFKILDAGGQRSERKKWLRSFEDITAVLFVLAVSEYDQYLFEDNKVNRMHEAMMLFKTLVNSKWFIDTPFILFLNKTDLFEQKIKKKSMRTYLPDYTGKAGLVEEGLRYFEKTFERFNRTKKPIYIHRTCATDTKSMKFVLAAVTDLFIQNNLKATGMM